MNNAYKRGSIIKPSPTTVQRNQKKAQITATRDESQWIVEYTDHSTTQSEKGTNHCNAG